MKNKKFIIFLTLTLSLTLFSPLFAEFGLNLGCVNSFNPHAKKEIALTFDACSGNIDKEIINFLIKNRIKATLFLSGKWLKKNRDYTKFLSRQKIFEIENHGLTHRPLTVKCESAYGIKGLCSKKEVFDEIKKNELLIYNITGRKTKFFRSGTAHYDTEAVKIAHKLGYKLIGFTVNADFGATASIKVIYNQLLKAKPGDIVIAHMNHPEKNTFEGFKKALPVLINKGYKFVKLDEVLNKN